MGQLGNLQRHALCNLVWHIQPDCFQGILRRALVVSQLPKWVKSRIALAARETKVCALIFSLHIFLSKISETGVKLCFKQLISRKKSQEFLPLYYLSKKTISCFLRYSQVYNLNLTGVRFNQEKGKCLNWSQLSVNLIMNNFRTVVFVRSSLSIHASLYIHRLFFVHFSLSRTPHSNH